MMYAAPVETPTAGGESLKVKVLNQVFNDDNIKKRVESYVDKVYCPSNENRKIRKAFKNQLYDTIKAENRVIMDNIRVLEGKSIERKRRKRKTYQPTPYVLFCREMKRKHPNENMAGKVQQMWRDKKHAFIPEVVVEPIPTDEELGIEWDYVSDENDELN